MLPQEADCAFQLLSEAVDLFGCGGEAEAGPGGAGQTVMVVQGLSAVVAAADTEARRIQPGGPGGLLLPGVERSKSRFCS